MKIFENINQLVGNTPLMRLGNVIESEELGAEILAKLECFNPTGSAKDRPALKMILDAEEKGLLKKDAVIVEPTSGNTGIGLAAMGGAMGYKVIIIMPDTASVERVRLTEAYGAQVVLTPGALGMKGCIDEANRLADETEGAFIPSQFDNPSNPDSHYESTGPEIWSDTEGKVDIFVSGIGTGGTISGVGRYLKERKPDIKIVGVEPLKSPLLTQGIAGAHGIQGIGANFVPENLDRAVIDEVIDVSDEDAYHYSRLLAQKEGIAVGISAGAALCGAAELAKRSENKGKTIVVLLTDTGERYLSTKLYDKE